MRRRERLTSLAAFAIVALNVTVISAAAWINYTSVKSGFENSNAGRLREARIGNMSHLFSS